MKRKASFVPNARDVAILQLVFEHRYMSIELLAALLCEPAAAGRQYGFTVSALRARCQKLRENRYLVWRFLADQPTGRGWHTERPAIYAIGPAAVDLLTESYGEKARRVCVTVARNTVKSLFLRHELSIARFQSILRLACRATGTMVQLTGWIQGPALRDSVMVGSGPSADRIPVVPDAAFALTIKGKGTAHYMLEYDRGTMPLADIRQKALGYWYYYRSQMFRRKYSYRINRSGEPILYAIDKPWNSLDPAHQKAFVTSAIASFQVLFVTRSTEKDKALILAGKRPSRLRQANLFRTVQEVPDIPPTTSKFLFATDELDYRIDDPEAILRAIWQSPKANNVVLHSLLD
ncbi:MAG: replication-relaxation family protein [bacterium]|nr:replication-relaxation family protein [bacterium]